MIGNSSRALRVLALLMFALLFLPSTAGAVFERVGPVLPQWGFPAWYQDKTGLTLEFCTPTTQYELDTGYCLLLTGDTTAPEVFPTSFFDEHFYYAADVVGTHIGGGATKLVTAIEGAFATGPVIAGEQVVFGRFRFDVRDLPLAGTYTLYTPHGSRTFPGMLVGDRLFYTEDIGLTCNLGDFTCALQAGIGPFLLPSTVPGGLENPLETPFADPLLPGRLYIAAPGRVGPVTGSIEADYVTPLGTFNPNRFRIECDTTPGVPGGDVEVFDSTDFALMGRIYQEPIPSRVTVDRASYARSVAGNISVDVFATGDPTLEPRLPAAPAGATTFPDLQFYDLPCGGTPDPLNPGGVLPPYTAPAGTPIVMPRFGNVFYGHDTPAAIPAGVCVANMNAKNAQGVVVPHYDPAPLGDQVFISEAYYDPSNSTLNVFATSSDDFAPPELSVGAFGALPANQLMVNGGIAIGPITAPPATVHVLSQEGGVNTMQVKVGRRAATGVTLNANRTSPVVAGNAVVFTAAGAGSTGYSYRFLLSADGGATFAEVQPYSATASWTMPAATAAGSYIVRVEVRTTAGVAFDAFATLAFNVRLAPAQTLTLAVSPASPANLGAVASLTATATGSSGYSFKFSRSSDGGVTYVLARDWSPDNVLPIDTTTVGLFRYQVEVRTYAGVARDLISFINYTVRNPPVTGVTLALSPTGIQPVNGVATLTATATTSVVGQTVFYKFYRSADGGLTYVVVRDSAVENSIPVDTTTAGAFRYLVEVSANPTLTSRELSTSISVTVQAPQPPAATGITLVANPLTSAPANSVVVFTATATSTTPGLTFEYRFWLSSDGGVTFVQQQAYGTTNTWTMPTATAGSYRVLVDARTVGRTNNRDTFSQQGYVITP